MQIALCVCLCFTLISVCSATTFTWVRIGSSFNNPKSSSDGNWEDDLNWNIGRHPSAETDDVIITSTFPSVYRVILATGKFRKSGSNVRHENKHTGAWV